MQQGQARPGQASRRPALVNKATSLGLTVTEWQTTLNHGLVDSGPLRTQFCSYPSICHAPVLCRNGLTCYHIFYTIRQPHQSSFPTTSRHIKARVSERTLRSSAVPLLNKPFTRTDFARRAFRCSASTVWNSLPDTIISADSLSVFKSRLTTYFSRRLLINTNDWPAASASGAKASASVPRPSCTC